MFSTIDVMVAQAHIDQLNELADAKRLVDFASGLAFALEGRIERVTSKVFLLTPSNLEVLGVANSENTADFNSEGEFPFDQG